jgi:hypothetical protein
MILATGETSLKKESRDVSVGVKQGGNDLSLRRNTKQRNLDLTLQQSFLNKLLRLITKWLGRGLFALSIRALSRWCPDTSNGNDSLNVLLWLEKQTQHNTVTVQDLFDNTLQLVAQVTLDQIPSASQLVGSIDLAIIAAGPSSLSFILGKGFQCP